MAPIRELLCKNVSAETFFCSPPAGPVWRKLVAFKGKSLYLYADSMEYILDLGHLRISSKKSQSRERKALSLQLRLGYKERYRQSAYKLHIFGLLKWTQLLHNAKLKAERLQNSP